VKNRKVKKRRAAAIEKPDFEDDKNAELKRTSPGGVTTYITKEYNHDYIDNHDQTELSNFGGKFTQDPETTKLNKRGSKESWFKSDPVSIQSVPQSIPEKID
jgi:hypothetical protein